MDVVVASLPHAEVTHATTSMPLRQLPPFQFADRAYFQRNRRFFLPVHVDGERLDVAEWRCDAGVFAAARVSCVGALGVELLARTVLSCIEDSSADNCDALRSGLVLDTVEVAVVTDIKRDAFLEKVLLLIRDHTLLLFVCLSPRSYVRGNDVGRSSLWPCGTETCTTRTRRTFPNGVVRACSCVAARRCHRAPTTRHSAAMSCRAGATVTCAFCGILERALRYRHTCLTSADSQTSRRRSARYRLCTSFITRCLTATLLGVCFTRVSRCWRRRMRGTSDRVFTSHTI
jgi:hypothetical protein